MTAMAEHYERCQQALAAGGAEVEPQTGDRIRFRIENGTTIPGEARVTTDWLSIRASSPLGGPISADARSMWDRLLRNAEMKGPLRYAVGPLGGERFRADIPLGDSGIAHQDVLEVCSALHEAAAGPCGRRRRVRDDSNAGDPEVNGSTAGAVRERFACSVWDLLEKDGALYATLDVPGRLVQARIQPRGEDRFQALAQLAAVPGDIHSACQHALGLFLLTVSDVGRLVRPGLCEESERARIQCAVTFRARATDAGRDLHRALSALSVVAGLCLREVKALMQENVAAAYLAVRAADRIREGKRYQERRRKP